MSTPTLTDTVLVTVGTTSHDVLVNLSLSTPFMKALIDLHTSGLLGAAKIGGKQGNNGGSSKNERNIITVFVQYGGMDKEEVERRLESAVNSMGGKRASEGGEQGAKIRDSASSAVDVPGATMMMIPKISPECALLYKLFPYTPNLPALTSSSCLILTHGGAGSIIESFRAALKPRVIVVPNETLMDNHQLELAGVVGEMGMGVWTKGKAGGGETEEDHFAEYLKEYVKNGKRKNLNNSSEVGKKGTARFRNVFKTALGQGDRSSSSPTMMKYGIVVVYVGNLMAILQLLRVVEESFALSLPGYAEILVAVVTNHVMTFFLKASRATKGKSWDVPTIVSVVFIAMSLATTPAPTTAIAYIFEPIIEEIFLPV
ncbi:hypothetical protein TrCOL_g937 [Triparma columacea]|uniref:UDP-N-acetylglucosamine transferase subunit ALG13 n=1 Tax=Triparma columacea TaxID=722753 RepID=A0A9W7L8L0_9STRA|nr:hypothetical protein TrCOL_g937 [Triparma columacea]